MRLVALEGGGAWTDASVDYLIVPDTLTLTHLQQQRQHWYEYYIQGLRARENPTYYSLAEFAVAFMGCQYAEEEITVWRD